MSVSSTESSVPTYPPRSESLPPGDVDMSDGVPTPYPGERFLSKWTQVKFFLGAPDPHPSGWASLAAFYCFGTAYLSTCRLILVPDPPLARSSPQTLSIPLVWLKPDKLHIRRPFFDSNHLFGVLVPADVSHAAMGPPSIFATPGKPMEFRIEMLDSSMNDRLCVALQQALADPERVARETRVLRNAVNSQLVPTDEHFAFVDPDNPKYLYLATQMTYPSLRERIARPRLL